MSDVTRVRVSFYKPAGWEETWFVRTDDRGLAVRAVLQHLDKQVQGDAKHLNYAFADRVGKIPVGANILDVP